MHVEKTSRQTLPTESGLQLEMHATECLMRNKKAPWIGEEKIGKWIGLAGRKQRRTKKRKGKGKGNIQQVFCYFFILQCNRWIYDTIYDTMVNNKRLKPMRSSLHITKPEKLPKKTLKTINIRISKDSSESLMIVQRILVVFDKGNEFGRF